MKLISLILIFSIFFSCQSLVWSQTVSRYQADLIVKKTSSAEKKEVFISLDNEAMNIFNKKDKSLNRSLPNSTIKMASYSYSEKPQIAEAIALTLAFGWLPGFAFFFTKKKKHWLILSTDSENFLFELNKENYRQLLFEMNSQKIKVEDLGDKNKKE